MQTAAKTEFVSVEDYLAAEEVGATRHEYLGGFVYAMAGETRAHNQIVQNMGFALRLHLQKGPCKLYLSDIRVNFDLHRSDYFYYPDIVVTCDKRDTHPRFIRHPKLIIEVLSDSMERADRGEKFHAYTGMESLDEYALISQNSKEVTVFRRAAAWEPEEFSGDESMATLKSLKVKIPLAAIYADL